MLPFNSVPFVLFLKFFVPDRKDSKNKQSLKHEATSSKGLRETPPLSGLFTRLEAQGETRINDDKVGTSLSAGKPLTRSVLLLQFFTPWMSRCGLLFFTKPFSLNVIKPSKEKIQILHWNFHFNVTVILTSKDNLNYFAFFISCKYYAQPTFSIYSLIVWFGGHVMSQKIQGANTPSNIRGIKCIWEN